MTMKIRKTIFLVRFEVLTEVTIKSVILWDVTPYILFQRNFLPLSPDYMQSDPRRQHCLTFLVAYINFTNNAFKCHTSMVHWQAHLSFEMESLVISTTLSSLEQNASDKPEHVGGESICFLHCDMLIRHGHITKQYELKKKMLLKNFHTHDFLRSINNNNNTVEMCCRFLLFIIILFLVVLSIAETLTISVDVYLT